MSLYREVGSSRRAVAVAGVIALVVGLGVGFGLGRSTAPDPDLAEQVAELGDAVKPALSALSLLEVEYPQAVSPQGEVIAETEIGAAESLVATAVSTLESAAPDLEALNPVAYEKALVTTNDVGDAVGGREPPDDVAALAGRASEAIRAASGGAAD